MANILNKQDFELNENTGNGKKQMWMIKLHVSMTICFWMVVEATWFLKGSRATKRKRIWNEWIWKSPVTFRKTRMIFGKSKIRNTSEKCVVDMQSLPAQISTQSSRAIVKPDRLTFC